jgi:hypothetical protein
LISGIPEQRLAFEASANIFSSAMGNRLESGSKEEDMDNSWQPWVWIKWKAGTPSTVWEGWQGNPQIKRAWSTQGEWDCCLSLDVTDNGQLENFVWKEIRSNEWVDSTRTMWAKDWW